MVIKDDKFYFKKDLMNILREKGLPHSHVSIIKYEKLGLIRSPRRSAENFKYKWRIYTGAEIREIVQILSERMI